MSVSPLSELESTPSVPSDWEREADREEGEKDVVLKGVDVQEEMKEEQKENRSPKRKASQGEKGLQKKWRGEK
jgi:hypothetical protein